MSSETLRQRAWQAEADLLAEGRDLLERVCATRRYAYLYPHGANIALLLEAYESLDRWRKLRHRGRTTQKQELRHLRRLLRRAVRNDALARDRRLKYDLPLPTSQELHTPLPDLVLRALTQVDADARREVEDTIVGRTATVDAHATVHGISPRARIRRGLDQFRDALMNLALANPAEIPGLHEQFVGYVVSDPPTRRRHPIAAWVFVTLPLQLMLWTMAMFIAAYLTAYLQFNDDRLGAFLTHSISEKIDGELHFDSVHWRPRLIVDLALGQPTPVDAYGVRVYAPFKSLGKAREEVDLAAHGEHLELGLVLHEIIPWNRLGVPTWLEIPWTLHFTEATNQGRLWIRSADMPTERGLLNTLTDAFAEPVPTPLPPGQRGLSIRLDRAEFANVQVALELAESQSWATQIQFATLAGRLDFVGQHADEPEPERLPFRFQIQAAGGDGLITLPDMLDTPMVAHNLALAPLEDGYGQTAVGDMRLRGSAILADSPTSFDGVLRDVFGTRTTVGFQLATSDAGGLADLVWAPTTDVAVDERPLVSAPGAAAKLTIEGPLDDPSIHVAGQGITIDPFPDPAWALDDVDLSVTLVRDPVPEMWQDVAPHRSASDMEERWVIYIDTFRGAALDGELRLHRGGSTDHIVLADESIERDPLLVSLFVDLSEANLAQLVADYPELAESLRGTASGAVDLNRFVMHDEGDEAVIDEADIYLHRLTATRDQGPRDDGLPRQLTADGTITYADADGLDVRGLRLGTSGGHLLASGGLSPDASALDPTQLTVRVDDGPAFLEAFGLDPFFDQLLAEITLHGSLGGPSSEPGTLSVTGIRGGSLTLSGIRNARIWLDRGTLFIRSPKAELLGGTGPLEVDFVLFERGQLLDDPRLRVFLDLEDLDSEDLFGTGIAATNAALRLYVDDGNNAPVPLSRMAARGAAYAEELEVAGTKYRHADGSFRFHDNAIDIERLAVAYHRPVSPLHAPGVAVEVGALTASGTIGLDDDPRLDLEVAARNLPLTSLTRIAGLDDTIRGYVANGTAFSIEGTMSSPDVHGQLRLDSLSVAGVPLGAGSLAVNTQRHLAEAERPAHRIFHAQGRFSDAGRREASLAWSIDGRVAVGAPPTRQRVAPAPTEADLTVRFDTLPVGYLLAHPDRQALRSGVAGQLRDASVRARYCPAGSMGLLPGCEPSPGPVGSSQGDENLSIEARVGHVWLAPEAARRRRDPCTDASAVCSENPLEVTFRDSLVELREPWRIRTGGNAPAVATLDGTIDLLGVESVPPDDCRQRPPVTAATGRGHATLRGDIDLAALAPWLERANVRDIHGRVQADLTVNGAIDAPVLNGSVRADPVQPTLALRYVTPVPAVGVDGEAVAATEIPLEVANLAVDIDRSVASLLGNLQVFSDNLRIGQAGSNVTELVVTGPCTGHYQLAATGELDGNLPHALFPEVVHESSGTMELERLLLAGQLGGDPNTGAVFDEADVLLGFDGHATRVQLDGQRIDIRGGSLQARVCTPTAPCGDYPAGSMAIFLGGERGAYAGARPRQAIDFGLGERSGASLWGVVVLSPDLDGIAAATVHARLSRVPYLQTDNSGRPELEALLSSDQITLEADATGSLSVRGDVLVERSRWIRDAVQGVAILSFDDPAPAAPTQLPAILRDLRLDIGLRTSSPFQIDNNVLQDVEGQAEVHMAGTLADPELTGELTVERGVLDLAILGDEYLIDHGRVIVERDFADSYVDLVAVAQDPVRIDNQLYYITVHLYGSIDEIRWECSALGETSGQLGTARGCVEYLVFDAGDVNAAQSDTIRGTSSPLLYTGKPLALVSKLLELNLNTFIEDEVPRVEAYLPEMWVRAGHLGLEAELKGRPDWLAWNYGSLGFDLNYLRGYPGALLRDSYSLTARIELLERTAIESKWGRRSYSQRVLVLEPAQYRSVELVRSLQIPSLR